MDRNAATIYPPPEIFSLPFAIENDAVKEFHQLGTIVLADGKKLGIYEIKTKPKTHIPRNRVQMRQLVAKKCRESSEDGALAAYYSETTHETLWRFSFISMEYKMDDGRVKREESSPKRYTYLLGEGARIRTAIDRFSQLTEKTATLEYFKTAFGVEQLNKEFYKKLFNWYTEAKEHVSFPNDTAEEEDNHRSISLIRLITRLLFIWFIKEKGLVNPDFFDENKVRQRIYWNKDSSYYKAILQNLFFATLNQEIKDRGFRVTTKNNPHPGNYSITNIYRYQNLFSQPDETSILNLFKQTPFLNGGLFECLDREVTDQEQRQYHEDKTTRGERNAILIDGFSDRQDNPLHIPNELFFNNDDNNPGLIDLLGQYQFTVEEGTPLDMDVALDPELLGLVFENLLASYNHETRETARRQTGSYYTPRQIVNYMVDESLKAYFSKAVPPHNGDADFRKRLDDLFTASSETNDLTKENGSTLIYQEEIPHLIETIEKIKILDPAVGSGAFLMGMLHRLVSLLNLIDPDNTMWKRWQIDKINALADPENRKQTLRKVESISNQYNDFGRKLYLIENAIYGVDIQPIAIQIAKLRFFISLTIEQEPTNNAAQNYGIKPLPNLETKFVAANSLIVLNKPKQLDFGSARILDKENKLKNVRRNYFTAKTLNTKNKYKEQDEKLRKEIAELLTKEARWNNNVAGQIAHWNPYDQNATADWFDAKQMFGIENGFDIVIGNPPYIQLQKNRGKLGQLYQKTGYETFAGTGDIYQLFYEKGYNMLTNGGHLCYITSNKWMRAAYGEKLREYFATKTNPIALLDFGGFQVFENATVDTNIILIQKADPNNEFQATSFRNNFKKGDSISQYVQNNVASITISSGPWFIGSSAELTLKEKIENIGKPLKDWDINIYRGVVTGYNVAFIIDNATKEALIKEDPKSAEILKPILRGRDIRRYHANWANLWLIATFPALKLNINDYPAIKFYLLSFDKDRLAQEGRVFPDGTKSRAKTGNQWFELQHNCAYHTEFNKTKIIYSNMTKYLSFLYDEKNFFTNDKCFIITGQHLRYLTVFFNTNIAAMWIRMNCPRLQGGIELRKIFFENIPIPLSREKDLLLKVDSLVKSISEEKFNQNSDIYKLESEVSSIFYKLYDFNSKEIDFIENHS